MLKKLFGILFIILFHVVLPDSPNTKTMDEIGDQLKISIGNQTKGISTEILNIGKQEQEFLHEKLLYRNSRSVSSNDLLQSQFDQHCRGYQPCTCYYPDHPNVTIFELGTDETTINAAGINGIGPDNCADLKQLGYSLKGFHIVRFNSKTVKIVYCTFNQTSENKTTTIPTKVARIRRSLKATVKPKVIKCCGGFDNKSCSFYYPDYPDAINFYESSKNVSNEDNSSKEGPKNCDHLQLIGYKLAGFYMVRLTAMKLKTIYCDFRELTNKNMFTKAEESLKNNASLSLPNVSKFCSGFGSQPCSCYYPNFRDLLQFELSSDEITRSASKANGKGPASCQDLEKLKHKLSGFYMVRFKDNIMKIIYCKFVSKKPKKSKKVSQPMLPTTPIPITYKVEETTKVSTRTKKTKGRTITTTDITDRPEPDDYDTTIADLNYERPDSDEITYQENENRQRGESKIMNIGVAIEKLINPFGSFVSLFRGRRNTFNNQSSSQLKNKSGKCLAVCTNGTISPADNGAKVIQSYCNSQEKGQFWRVMGDHLCNGWNKCLSLQNNTDQKHFNSGVIIHTDLNTDSWLQKWKFENPGRILNNRGCCLGVYFTPDSSDGEVIIEKCNSSNKGQWWSFIF